MPVIVLSADVACDPNDKLLALGIVEFISKPFDIDHLERTVDAWSRN
ncbi:MAG: response regulator [Gemmataceae bacterium]|nr:response regulator [Gemmataceae bacterium]